MKGNPDDSSKSLMSALEAEVVDHFVVICSEVRYIVHWISDNILISAPICLRCQIRHGLLRREKLNSLLPGIRSVSRNNLP